MPMRTVGARVKIDGEAEYKRALQELNSSNRVLSAEMKKLDAQYAGNTKSTEYLTKRGELLQRQLTDQKDKVATLRDALAKSAEATGESSEQTKKWQIQLANAEAAQYNLEHAIEANNDAMQENGKAVEAENQEYKGLGTTLSDIAGKFGIQIPEGASQALNGMMSFSSGSVAVLGAAVAAVTAMVAAVKKLNEMTLEAATNADDLLTQSMTTGLSTKTLQELKYAEQLIDVSVDTITGSLTKLTKNIAAAGEGNKKMAEAFADLGVSIKDADGNLRDAEDVFYDVIDALGGIENQTERDAAAMELLGKGAQELNPLILQGSDALRALGEEAEAAGYILDESQIQKLGEVDDAYQKMQKEIEATKQLLAVEFADASAKSMETFAQAVTDAGRALANSGIIKGLGEVVQYATALLDPLGALLGLSPQVTQQLRPLYEILHGIAGVFAWIADAGNAAIGLLTGFTKAGRTRFNTALGLNAQYGMYSHLQEWNGTAAEWEDWRNSGYSGYRAQGYGYDSATGQYYDVNTGNYIYSYNASGNQNWRGGLTWVGESGPELAYLPSGSQIMSAQESRKAAGGDTFIINIDPKNVREFNDLVRIAENARVTARMR